MDEFLSIGEVARASGLSVSALRFYDSSGVLVPAHVAADTGYRWYTPSQRRAARLLARLRRIGLPLAEISTVLAHQDAQVTREILDEHLRRLEEGVDAARAEVQRIRHWWTGSADGDAVVVVDGADLVQSLRSVRYAIGADSQWPALGGVLVDTADEVVRFSATDRYRAAFHEIPAQESPDPVRQVLPAGFVDRLIERCAAGARVELSVGGGRVRATFAGQVEEAELLDADFPDLRSLVPEAALSAVVDRDLLLADLHAAPHVATWYLGVNPEGTVALSAAASDEHHGVTLDGQFLTQALQSAGPGQLQLDLAGPIAPLAVRRAEQPDSFGIIMPIRPEAPAR